MHPNTDPTNKTFPYIFILEYSFAIIIKLFLHGPVLLNMTVLLQLLPVMYFIFMANRGVAYVLKGHFQNFVSIMQPAASLTVFDRTRTCFNHNH